MKEYAMTYKQRRKCLYCETPIADQIHQGRYFCEREVLSNGSVKSCKDDFNARLRKQRDKPFREQKAFQQRLSLAIDNLYRTKGEQVTVDDLQCYEIWLEMALRNEPKGERLFNFVFTHHRLEQLSMTQFKIHPHAHPL